MPTEFDVVVIGAGNGGLTASCVASSLGLRTLLVEQHNLPGGLATSFVRGRFEFEPSLHELSGIGTNINPGAVRSLFDRIGIDVDWRPIPEACRIIVTDDNEKIDVSLPFGVQEYIDKVESYIPGSKEYVSNFLQICRDVVDGISYIASSKGNPDPNVLENEHGNLLRTAGVSVDDVEDFLQMPKKVRTIVNAFWCYLGLDTSQFEFQMYAMLLYNKLIYGAHVPRMRSHEIATALDIKIRENGGTILYNTQVAEINVQNGEVKGVTLSNGEKINTNHVISNATHHTVFGKLIRPETEIPKKQIQMANSRKRFFSAGVVYLGLNKSKEELGLNEYSCFIFPTGDNKVLYKDTASIDRSRAQAAVCLNAAVPDCSPEGTTILHCLVLHNEQSWNNAEPEDYFKIKNKIAGKVVGYFEKSLGVKISDSIEEIEVATPVTYARYTGNYKGEVLGPLPVTWDSILARAMMAKEEDSIKGLRFCGKGVDGGYARTLLSGETAAYLTLEDITGEEK